MELGSYRQRPECCGKRTFPTVPLELSSIMRDSSKDERFLQDCGVPDCAARPRDFSIYSALCLGHRVHFLLLDLAS
jgi:hypothetical protein